MTVACWTLTVGAAPEVEVVGTQTVDVLDVDKLTALAAPAAEAKDAGDEVEEVEVEAVVEAGDFLSSRGKEETQLASARSKSDKREMALILTGVSKMDEAVETACRVVYVVFPHESHCRGFALRDPGIYAQTHIRCPCPVLRTGPTVSTFSIVEPLVRSGPVQSSRPRICITWCIAKSR